jgi:Protein of unknown function (DUF2934)
MQARDRVGIKSRAVQDFRCPKYTLLSIAPGRSLVESGWEGGRNVPRSSVGTKRVRAAERNTQPSQERTLGPSNNLPQLHDRIAVRAFEIYEQRGKKHGHDLDDWFRAEQELLGQRIGFRPGLAESGDNLSMEPGQGG